MEYFLRKLKQDADDCKRTLARVIQCGKVTALNGQKARVLFEDTGITSDWLPVLQHTGSMAMNWMPQIGNLVVVLFLPIPNADGFILGVIP